MYRLTEEQRNTLLYIIERLTVTGPDQGALLSSAANILRPLRPEEGGESHGSKNSTSHN